MKNVLFAYAAAAAALACPSLHAQFNYPAGFIPVGFQYTCTGPVLKSCHTSFSLPAGKLLVVQTVSGIVEQGFPTSDPVFFVQVSTSLANGLNSDPVLNTFGPNYYQTTDRWTFTNAVTIYSTTLPVVTASSAGTVAIQGFLIDE